MQQILAPKGFLIEFIVIRISAALFFFFKLITLLALHVHEWNCPVYLRSKKRGAGSLVKEPRHKRERRRNDQMAAG